MGGSYGNLLAIGVSRDRVAASLGNQSAYLAVFDDVVAVFSEAAVVDTMSASIDVSRLARCDVVGFAVLDDDVLASVLCRDGEIVAEVTVPNIEDYFGISEDELELMAEWTGEAVPSAGNDDDAVGFVHGVGRGDARRALAALSDDFGKGEAIFATDRHSELLAALQLPTAIAGWDYYAFENDVDGFEGEVVFVAA